MSRYFFDLHNGQGLTLDDEGLETSSRETISREVTRILVDVARDELTTDDRAVISVSVRNEAGKTISVASLTFDIKWLE
jgi:hypothetical protein